MRKLLILLSILVLAQTIGAQGNRKIKYRADMGFYDEEFMPGAQRLVGNVAFAQGNVRGYCDSAYLYEDENYIIAYGDKVKILVGDSVRIFGRRAYYDGDDKIASIAVNVRLEKGKGYLLSDSLIYDTRQDIGYYVTGGKLVNEEDTMTSLEGVYYTKTDDAIAKVNVLLWNKDYRIDCEALKYNLASNTAHFISRTHLKSTDKEFFTSSGWYNTDYEIATLAQNVQLYNETKTLFADSVYYDSDAEYGIAWNNATLIDTAQDFILKGNYIEYHAKGGISIATDSNLLVLIDENRDSLFLHSDTLKLYIDDDEEMQWARAYNKVKFFRNDIQGVCDSMSLIRADSTLFMYYNPVIWSEDYQLSGDTIKYTALDSVNSQIELIKSGFIVGSLYEESDFNQIKGVNITGHLKNRELYRVDVISNAECVYYLQEEDSSLIGINTSLTSEMRVFLKKNEIQQIRFYDAPDGTVYPDDKFEEKDRKLQDFRWLPQYRPHTIEDLYINPIPRTKD